MSVNPLSDKFLLITVQTPAADSDWSVLRYIGSQLGGSLAASPLCSFGPVFSLAGSYAPAEGTSFTLEGHRRQQNSAVINGANFITTGGSLGARQRLRDSLFGTASFSYDHSDYEPTTRGVQTNRRDDYFLLRCGLEAILGRSWSLGVFYQYREDISSDDNYSFNNNQVGIQAAWGY